MYLLSSLLIKSDEKKIKKAYIKTYNYLCYDDIEDIETFELINGEIPTDKVFIQKLLNTIIDQNNNELYDKVISIYQ